MPPKSSNDNSAYKNKIKLDLEKLKNGQIQHVKVDLTKINIKTIATQFDLLSNDINIFMILPSNNRHYVLNDRTLNLVRKGNIDLNSIMHQSAKPPTFSDSEIGELIEQEHEVIVTAVNMKIEKHRPGGAFFSFLNKAIYDLSKYGIFKSVDKSNYHHNCLYLALQAGGLSDIKLQELILTLRHRTIHTCDLSNVCDALESRIEPISLRSDGEGRVEHYGKYVDETCNLGLIKHHCFINGYTELTSYCLENYEEIK